MYLNMVMRLGGRVIQVHVVIVSSRVGTRPFWVPPLSEANLKSYPLFLRAIQIGACKL